MSRLLRTIALGALAYALWEYLKRMRDEGPVPVAEPAGPAAEVPLPGAIPKQPPPSTTPSASSSTTAASGPSSSNGSGADSSKAELYEQAQKLGIPGRSKMSKSQLERAIRDAD
ncbi:MAG: Rho termination factor N-terminal domain-containing protein [Actinomycetota bacterium]|nr:Rho termination factor N-terminal domain-containing protein [Actinomycetota bacterium]